jgi:hypothetical protein
MTLSGAFSVGSQGSWGPGEDAVVSGGNFA